MKYKVLVLREICHEVEFEVEADNEDHAVELAKREATDKVFTVKHPTEYRVLRVVRKA